MTGQQHYDEAEADIDRANQGHPDDAAYLLARAQVHATLALVAATTNWPGVTV